MKTVCRNVVEHETKHVEVIQSEMRDEEIKQLCCVVKKWDEKIARSSRLSSVKGKKSKYKKNLQV